VDLGDRRLNRRSATLLETMATKPNVSFAHNPSGASPAPRSGALPPTPLPGAWLLDP
jgi:hypothetical protein